MANQAFIRSCLLALATLTIVTSGARLLHASEYNSDVPRQYMDSKYHHGLDSEAATASRDARNALRKEAIDNARSSGITNPDRLNYISNSIQGPAARHSIVSTGEDVEQVTGISNVGDAPRVISDTIADNDASYSNIKSFYPQCTFSVDHGVVKTAIDEFEHRVSAFIDDRDNYGAGLVTLSPINFVTLAFLNENIDVARYVFCKYKNDIKNQIDSDQFDPYSNGLVHEGTLHEIAVARDEPELIQMLDAFRAKTKFANKPHPVTGNARPFTKKNQRRVSRVSELASNYKGEGGIYHEVKK